MSKNALPDFLSMLWDITNEFWWVGAVVSIVFATAAAYTFSIIPALFENTSPVTQALSVIGYAFYIGPLILFVFSYFFALKAYSAFRNNN